MGTETSDARKPLGLIRGLGLWAATAVVIGSMIGQAVFLVASDMSREVGSMWKIGAVPRTAGRDKISLEISGTAEQGYLHCGPNGAGHFVKMVHNGMEYGIMAAYAEGLSILRSANVGKQANAAADAETTPLRDPEHYQYDMNLRDIAEVWRRGSVIASWLLDLTAGALLQDPNLSKFAGHVSDSGEGRWTIKAAIDEAVPAPVLTTALYERFSSRGEADFANKLLSAMRYQFGGHLEKSEGKSKVA
jgi:6-phosphogluconate dehydrogenase